MHVLVATEPTAFDEIAKNRQMFTFDLQNESKVIDCKTTRVESDRLRMLTNLLIFRSEFI